MLVRHLQIDRRLTTGTACPVVTGVSAIRDAVPDLVLAPQASQCAAAGRSTRKTRNRGTGRTPNVGPRGSSTDERCKEDQRDPLVAAAAWREEGSVLRGRLEPRSDACHVVGVPER